MEKSKTSEEKIFHATSREKWRQWLEQHFLEERLVWLLFPRKSANIESVSYSDAVEEALCFGWIDSTMKTYNDQFYMQRFSVRNPKSTYSQLNRERLLWLHQHNLIHPSVIPSVLPEIQKTYSLPPDIIETLQQDPMVWEHFLHFSDSYKRIRLAYIEAARSRPEEFAKRLNYFISMTKANKLIIARGSEKYY